MSEHTGASQSTVILMQELPKTNFTGPGRDT